MDHPKILLIEDEQFIREIYKRQLDRAGLITDAFATGKEGLAALQQNHYDLVLLDIMLPDINGLEVLKQIKETLPIKNTPVVLLTNLGQEEIIKQGFELGAQGYLIKASYDPDQIVMEAKNFIGKNPQPTV